MKVGDIVIRKEPASNDGTLKADAARLQRHSQGHGIILKKYMAGKPVHPCIDVYYFKTGKIYGIAESLMEVISEA